MGGDVLEVTTRAGTQRCVGEAQVLALVHRHVIDFASGRVAMRDAKIALGHVLRHVKAQLGHGRYLGVLAAAHVPRRTAAAAMKLARALGDEAGRFDLSKWNALRERAGLNACMDPSLVDCERASGVRRPAAQMGTRVPIWRRPVEVASEHGAVVIDGAWWARAMDVVRRAPAMDPWQRERVVEAARTLQELMESVSLSPAPGARASDPRGLSQSPPSGGEGVPQSPASAGGGEQ